MATAQPMMDHDPIAIHSDAALRQPDLVGDNGVRSGSGTAGDPYVISHWRIEIEDLRPAIEIQNTQSHILIHNVSITRTEKGAERGIHLSQAAHVTIRDIRLSGGFIELRADDSADVTVERAIIPTGRIEVWNMVDLTLDRNQVGVGRIGGTVSGPTTVTGNLVERTPRSLGGGIEIAAHIYEGRVFPVVLTENRVLGAEHAAILVTGAKQARICDNMVVDSVGYGIYASILDDESDASAGSAEICDNYVRGGGESGLYVLKGRDVHVHNNTLKEARWGLNVDPFGGQVRDNLIVGNVIGMAFLVGDDAVMPEIRHNLLLDNEVAATSWHSDVGPFDLSENWWGTEEDPRAAGERTGTNRVEGDVVYAPWCLDSECRELGDHPGVAAGAPSAGALVMALGFALAFLVRTRR